MSPNLLETVRNFDIKWQYGLAINVQVGDVFNRRIGLDSALYVVMYRWLRPNRIVQLCLLNCEPPHSYNGTPNLAYHEQPNTVEYGVREHVGYVRITDDLIEEWLTCPFVNIRIAAKKAIEAKSDPNNKINRSLRCS